MSDSHSEGEGKDEGQGATHPGTFSSLGIPNFRYLWLGQVCHAAALWMEQVSIPFLIFDIAQGSAAHLGGVMATRMLPQIVFGLFGGIASDWFDRRKVLLIDKSAILVINTLFAGIIIAGRLELWHVYAYSLLRGGMLAFDQPARQSLIPSVVPADRVINAVALMSATQNAMRIAGATLGGLAYEWFGPEATFSSIAAIYVGAVASTYLLDVPTPRRGSATLSAMRRGLVEGIRFAIHSVPIRGVLGLTLVYYGFGIVYVQIFLPLFADRIFEIGSSGFGAMTALMGAGAISTAILIAKYPPIRLGLILPITIVVLGCLLVIFSGASYLPRPAGLVLPLVIVTITGGLHTAFLSLSRAVLLHAAPEALRGRVLSLLSFDRAFFAGGAATAGFLAAAIGVQPAQILYGVLCAVGGLIVLVVAPEFRRCTTVFEPAPSGSKTT